MSRLRARTWTALERRVMGYWKNRNLLRLIILERHTGRKWGHDLALDAADRIMRTKGIVATLANYQYALQQAEDAQWVSRRPCLAMRRIVRSAAWCRRTRIGFIPSDSNPNIYVRREV